MAVLFCDLRGFTRMSEQLEPHEVREVLEVYFEETSRIILKHDGTVLRFVEDNSRGVRPPAPRRITARGLADVCPGCSTPNRR